MHLTLTKLMSMITWSKSFWVVWAVWTGKESASRKFGVGTCLNQTWWRLILNDHTFEPNLCSVQYKQINNLLEPSGHFQFTNGAANALSRHPRCHAKWEKRPLEGRIKVFDVDLGENLVVRPSAPSLSTPPPSSPGWKWDQWLMWENNYQEQKRGQNIRIARAR